jgi:hypothetical protein
MSNTNCCRRLPTPARGHWPLHAPMLFEENGSNVILEPVTSGARSIACSPRPIMWSATASAGTASAPTRPRPSAASASGISIDNSLTCHGAYQTPRFMGLGPRHAAQPAGQPVKRRQPSAGRWLWRQGRAARHRHRRAALAQGWRPAGEVHRRPHGIPAGRWWPVLGPLLRAVAGRQGRRHRDRLRSS